MLWVVQALCAVLGFLVGFGAGLAVLSYIVSGEKITDVTQDKAKKAALGLMGWGFALMGAACGWIMGGALAKVLFG